MINLNVEEVKGKKITKIFGPDFQIYLLENEPRIYPKTISYSEAFYWKKSYNSEIEFIINNNILELVDLSPESKQSYKAFYLFFSYSFRRSSIILVHVFPFA